MTEVLTMRATRLLMLFVLLALLGNDVAFAKGSSKSRRTESVRRYTTKNGKTAKPYKRAPAGTSDAKKSSVKKK